MAARRTAINEAKKKVAAWPEWKQEYFRNEYLKANKESERLLNERD